MVHLIHRVLSYIMSVFMTQDAIHVELKTTKEDQLLKVPGSESFLVRNFARPEKDIIAKS